ncbi:PREDICTED: methyltransferase-like protein 13 [Erythranthe guttata]|uniref:methyltransferase-like protein 13 n=1 Tax=Erythranthe guttata TaxID=4155 RepID=UPI00064DC53F|nr:PREDICTED: methyltransferase-like protein 13 [Erythranthe guttata]|eukprot:XP_012855685.1 PREDICTED: methyltransferase-like protein 13 [Erythranthe guttata]
MDKLIMRRRKQKQKQNPPRGESEVVFRPLPDGVEEDEPRRDLFMDLGYLKRKENWEYFFRSRKRDEFLIEWYAEWPQIQSLLTDQLLSRSSLLPESAGEAAAVQPGELNILVPGCGSSRLSEHLYDAGFKQITNVDFSDMVIKKMSERNKKQRPVMKWRATNVKALEFIDKSMDVIIDKAALDAFVVSHDAYTVVTRYIFQVKRILKDGGRFICITVAGPIVRSILLFHFRFGWKTSVHDVPEEPESSSENQKGQVFMFVFEKDTCASVGLISTDIRKCESRDAESQEGKSRSQLIKELEDEQKYRDKYSGGSEVLNTLKDLNLEELKEYAPGRRIKLILGDPATYAYKGFLIDAQQDSGPCPCNFVVLFVPISQVNHWIHSSEEGQKRLLAKLKAARALIILEDSDNCEVPWDDKKTQLKHIVRKLAPRCCDVGVPIPFFTSGEMVKACRTVLEVFSTVTGKIIVEETVYRKRLDYHDQDQYPEAFSLDYDDDDLNSNPKDQVFRRLIFHQSAGMTQSEALYKEVVEENKKEIHTTKKKKRQIISGSSSKKASNIEREIDHDYLAHPYHNAIISGLMLISPHRKRFTTNGPNVETVVIGLGGGSLPMFMKKRLATVNIQVVEIDDLVSDIATKYFDFKEAARLRLHIADGLLYIKDKAHSEAAGKLDILIVDVGSLDLSLGLNRPSEEFVQESFLRDAKNCLSEEGLFVMSVFCGPSALRAAIHSTLKNVFGESLLCLQLKVDEEVFFGLKNESAITEDYISAACDELETSLEAAVNHKWTKRVIKASKLIRPLR